MENLSLNEQLTNKLTNNKNEINYWNIINDIGWYELVNSENALQNENVKEYLIGFMDVNFVSDFKNFVVDRRKEIQENYLKFSQENNNETSIFISDDSLWDVTSSIIGMGKSSYELALKTPKFIEFIYQTKNYKENFEYGFDSAIYEINDLTYEWECKQKNER